jgi:predicted Zn-dependent protease
MSLYREANDLLSELGADCEAPVFLRTEEISKDIEIVLAPVGKADRRFLEEVREELQKIMGVTYSIADEELKLGRVDRKSDESFLTIMVDRIVEGNPKPQLDAFLSENNLTDSMLKTYNGKVKFIEAVLREMEAPEEEIRGFHETLRQLKGTGQFDAARLLAKIRRQYPLGSRPEVKGYLGVTKEDIFAKDFNFLFGWAGEGHGLMSYHRFTNEFNGEPPNPDAVKKRTVKQAISSSLNILGIPRCSTPTCARAYPHSLSEHDRKGIEICTSCRGLLRAYIEANSMATATP